MPRVRQTSRLSMAMITVNLPSLLVRARGGDELTEGDSRDTLSRGCGCGPSTFGLGLNSARKSARSNPSSNSFTSCSSSGSVSPWYCSRNTKRGTVISISTTEYWFCWFFKPNQSIFGQFRIYERGFKFHSNFITKKKYQSLFYRKIN